MAHYEHSLSYINAISTRLNLTTFNDKKIKLEPITVSVIVIYIADKILEHFIQEEIWYKRILLKIFRPKNYSLELRKIIYETINDYEKKYPYKESLEKFPFYHSQILFDLLNQHLLFKKDQKILIIDEFKKNENIIKPNQEQLESFYKLFTDKVEKNQELKNLYIEENYKDEIFEISSAIADLITTSNVILQKVTAMEEYLYSANSPITQLRNRFEESIEIQKGYQLQGLEAFSKIARFSSRSGVVADLLNLFKERVWISIYGNIATGKTQLAVLVSEKYSNKFWIDFKDYGLNALPKLLLEEFCNHFNIKVSSKEDLDNLFSKLPNDSVIVLNDLPKLHFTKGELNWFTAILNSIAKHQIKLLTTSNFQIPESLKEHLSPSFLEEKQNPYFDSEEVKEVLLAYGAPEYVTEVLKSTVCNIAEGHPTIVNAIAKYLEKENWTIDEVQLIKLFKGDYSSQLQDQVYEKLVQTIFDSKTRELLYRCKIILGQIKNKEIDTVAAVKPIILLPHEKVNDLLGLWIQRTRIDTYQLSPLLKTLKTNNLTPAVFQSINHALGVQILLDKKLGPLEAFKAIYYFQNAKEYSKAGFILSLVLEGSLDNPESFFDYGFDSFWLTTKLPSEMDLFLQSVIRCLQVNILLKKQKTIDFLIEDLMSIIDVASKSNINVAIPALSLSLMVAEKEPLKANELLVLGLTHLEQLKAFDLPKSFFDNNINIESLVWHNLINARSLSDFNHWYESFSKLSKEQIENSLQTELYNIACSTFCSKLFDLEAKKETPNYFLLIEEYSQVIEKVKIYSLYILIATCYKYKYKCYCSKLNLCDKAVKEFDQDLINVSSNKIASFIIYDELGRQLFYSNRWEDALKYLLEASIIEVPKLYFEKIDTYLVLNEILGMRDKNVAHEQITRAFEFQNNNPYVDEVTSSKVIGELAISDWELNKSQGIFYIIEKGAEKILFTYKPLQDYQGTIIRYGHTINYYFHMIAEMPLKEIDGLPYAVPFRGFFSRKNDKLLEGGYYYEQRKLMLSFIIYQSFELIKDYQMAKKWADICFKLNEEDIINPFSSVLTGLLVYDILDAKYEEAIGKEIKILKSVNQLSSIAELEEKIPNEHLLNILKRRPRPTFTSFDNILFEWLINFIFLHVLKRYIESHDKEIVKIFVTELENIITYFDDKNALNILRQALLYLIEDKQTDTNILSLQNSKLELSTQVQLLLYLIASIKSTTLKALQLHLALVQRLEMISTLSGIGPVYELITIPFFEVFWKKRIEIFPADFFQYNFLIKKGYDEYEKAHTGNKIKKLFRILCHHLSYTPTGNEEKWLD